MRSPAHALVRWPYLLDQPLHVVARNALQLQTLPIDDWRAWIEENAYVLADPRRVGVSRPEDGALYPFVRKHPLLDRLREETSSLAWLRERFPRHADHLAEHFPEILQQTFEDLEGRLEVGKRYFALSDADFIADPALLSGMGHPNWILAEKVEWIQKNRVQLSRYLKTAERRQAFAFWSLGKIKILTHFSPTCPLVFIRE